MARNGSGTAGVCAFVSVWGQGRLFCVEGVCVVREWNDIDIELAKFLLEKVDGKENSWTYTYKEVAKEMENRVGRPINPHFGLSHPLGVVAEICFDLDLPLLTALVRHEGKKESIGEGFYSIACELKPQYKDVEPFKAWKQELAQIRQCKDWSALRDYLNRL